jgi:predicted glutamine amidotransferase
VQERFGSSEEETMCRWLAYSGDPIVPESFLFEAKHSLIDQSMCSRSAETPTNGDGFGIGWYGNKQYPGLFRSIRPAWNDFNLRDLTAQIDSPLFLAHVRATSLATVQETNCHPFRYKNWLFVHNGEIFEIEKLRRALLLAISEELFSHILGTTDSEVMFYVALTFGLETDPLGALARMAGFIEETGRKKGVAESLWMTVGVSDGASIWAVRYASDGNAPTLYHSREMDDVYKLQPHLVGRLSPTTRLIVSEPLGVIAEAWKEIPQNSSIRVTKGEIEIQPFVPIALNAAEAVALAGTA